MKQYSYGEIHVGHSETFAVEITEDMQDMFLSISGDNNPMHTDENYARQSGGDGRFTGKVVYGMLTASFYSTLVGTLLPGEKCLLQEADIKFRKPVYIGDVLQISGECVDKNDTFNLLIIKAKIRNQNNELVSTAKLRVGVRDE